MKQYCVILPIGKMATGSTYSQGQSLPLHCTIMPWFRIDSETNMTHLRNKLMLLACGEVELVSDHPEMFGLDTIPVHVLQRNNQLNLMHTELLVFLAKIDCVPAVLDWIGAGYHPHVADTDEGLSFPSGSRYTPKHLILIERGADKTKAVVNHYKLGDIPF